MYVYSTSVLLLTLLAILIANPSLHSFSGFSTLGLVMKIANEVSKKYINSRKSTQLCGLAGVRLQLAVPPVQYERRSVGDGFCGGFVTQRFTYGSFSQTPWFQVLQLPVFHFSPFSPIRLIPLSLRILY